MNSVPASDRPEVSVVIPVWNRSDMIRDALDSVYLQDFSGTIETIIVDDGSEDDTANVVRDWMGAHASPNREFKLLEKTHLGIAATVHAGIESTRGSYLMLLGSDDFWAPNRVSVLMREEAAAGGGVLIFTNVQRVDEEKRPLPADFYLGRPPFDSAGFEVWNPASGDDLGTVWLTYRMAIAGGTWIQPRANLEGDLALPSDIPEEDFWMSLVGFLRGSVRYLNSPTLSVRAHDGSITRQRAMKPSGDFDSEMRFVRRATALLAEYAPGDRRLTGMLETQGLAGLARRLRDESDIRGAWSAIAALLRRLPARPYTAPRVGMTIAYCIWPRAFVAIKSARYRRRYLHR